MIDKYVGPEKYLFIFSKEQSKCSECDGLKLVEKRLEKVLVTFLQVLPENELGLQFLGSLHGHQILNKSFPKENLVWYLSD